MIVGFSAYGTGSAKAAVTYLTSPTNLDGSRRDPAPVVLQGNPEFVSRDRPVFKPLFSLHNLRSLRTRFTLQGRPFMC
jgi:hypothetical protein